MYFMARVSPKVLGRRHLTPGPTARNTWADGFRVQAPGKGGGPWPSFPKGPGGGPLVRFSKGPGGWGGGLPVAAVRAILL